MGILFRYRVLFYGVFLGFINNFRLPVKYARACGRNWRRGKAQQVVIEITWL
jgi:hypothetical protein